MCGIAGWVDFLEQAPNGPLLRAMTRTLTHRGPDGEGYFERGPVHLGHRRLSIIDLATGDQPMHDETGNLSVVFNGEIFNYRGIMSDLADRGVKFRTNSDTESILRLYQTYGLHCVDHLRGQFAFALWDDRHQRLIIARDRMGQKPLYYVRTPGGLIFGSELPALLMHPGVSREIDLVALDAFMAYRFIPDPLSILKGVRKLPAAHMLVVTADGVEERRYWEPQFGEPLEHLTEAETLDRLDALLEEATRLRLIADVPLGAFLSGGIDSSLVVAYMARAAGAGVKTFTVGFAEEDYDERSYARLVAEQFQTDHHEQTVVPHALEALPTIVDRFGEPFADSSALAVYYVSEMTRRQVTVALNGDGGDESFAGYRRYKGTVQFDAYRRLPRWIRGANFRAARLLGHTPLGRTSLVRRLDDWHHLADKSLGEIYERTLIFPDPPRRQAFAPQVRGFLAEHGPVHMIAEALTRCPSKSTINRVLYADQQVYLPGDLLVKVDRMTMAHSLEGRSPLLDHEVVNFAARIPPRLKFKGGQQKYLLKQLALRHFPREFVERRKQGFGVPVRDWLRDECQPLLADCVQNSQLARDGLLDAVALRKNYKIHLAGQQQPAVDLWAVVCGELWYRRFSELPSAAAATDAATKI